MGGVINARKRTIVTPRHIILGIASAAVLGMVLYLFIQVRTTTASSAVPQRTGAAHTENADTTKPDEPSKVASRPANVSVRTEKSRHDTGSQAPAKSSGGGNEIRKSGEAEEPTETNVTEELAKPNPRMDAVMAEANKAYDRGEFEDAKQIALKVLAKEPANVRMLRIVVSSNCIEGSAAEAQKHYLSLPATDREQMKVRCERYGVTFNDK